MKKQKILRSVCLVTTCVVSTLSSLGYAVIKNTQEEMKEDSAAADSNLEKNLENHQQINKAVQEQKQWAEEETKKSIVPEAISVIENLNNVVKLITDGQSKQAFTLLESARQKVDGLLNRYHGKAAILPVDYIVNVYNTAPSKIASIEQFGNSAEKAVKDKNFPDSRLYLDVLRSEINVTVYSLPLELYPEAMKKAATLLEEQKGEEAALILQSALNAIVISYQTIPIPLIISKAFLTLAEEASKDKDKKEISKTFLALSKYQLERAKDLGYVANNKSIYDAIYKSVEELEKKLQSDTHSPSEFHKVRESISNFLKKYFDRK